MIVPQVVVAVYLLLFVMAVLDLAGIRREE